MRLTFRGISTAVHDDEDTTAVSDPLPLWEEPLGSLDLALDELDFEQLESSLILLCCSALIRSER